MNSNERAITQRLHDAADRVPVHTDAAQVLVVGHRRVVRRPSSRRRLVMAGVAVATTAAAVVVAVRSPSSTETIVVAPADPAGPADEASTASAGSVAAHVVSPPDWFGEPQAGYRDGAIRIGRWVSMAIGRPSTDAITGPIVISVFRGTYRPLDGAGSVTIDGASLRSIRFGGWQALAIDGTPTVMVGGSADERTLAAVLDAVEVLDPSGEFSLRLRSRPAGFAEIVPPRVLGPDPSPRRTLASEAGDAGINEVSDWTDPLLAAAASGADLTVADLGGGTGWIGRTTGNPVGPLRFLVWSPRPGVVFEITTDDMDRTDGDLIELALGTSVLDVDDWDSIYGE